MHKSKRTICFPDGFTLLELLVALALMNVIALTLYSSMYTGFKTKKSSQAALKPFQSVIPVFAYMRKDFTSAMQPDGILADEFLGEDQSGQGSLDSDTVTLYVCSYQPCVGEVASNIVKIEYVLEEDTELEQTVLKRLVTKNILSPREVTPQEEILCRGILGLDVKYYDGSSWIDKWDSSAQEDQLPWAVQVALTLNDEHYNRSSEAGLRVFTRTFMLPSANQDTAEQASAEAQ